MELKSTLEYKGYTIKTFNLAGKDLFKIYLGDEPVEYSREMDEQYEDTMPGTEGIEGAKQHIDLLEEKENSL